MIELHTLYHINTGVVATYLERKTRTRHYSITGIVVTNLAMPKVP